MMDGLGGEEMERALMDLGPLLGVSIKEEAPDDAQEAVPSGSVANASAGGEAAEAPGAEGAGDGDADKPGADSLASPGGRAALAAARCVLCAALLALADGTPKLMECLHSACEPCVKAKVEEKLASANNRDFLGAERVTIMCPACRLPCQTANMIDQRFVLEKMAIDQAGTNGASNGEQQCSSCGETEPATSYCVECAEFICESCVHAHQRLKITKDHTIRSKDEALADLHAASHGPHSRDMHCRDHPQERLALFCETCDRLTCRDCQLQHHRDHKYQFSTEMAQQARAQITGLLSEVSYKRVLLDSAMKVIRDRQLLIADKKKALVHDITQTVVKLTNAINTRGKQLVLRLNEVCDGKLRTLNEKRDALTQLAAVTDHCAAFVRAALQAGSDTALLYSRRAVTAHLQRIKARRADIPNPEIPVRISLALDPLPDLLRVLSTIGAIVVDGKVDGGGGGGGAQGPYHPPAAPAPPPPAPPHSAVVALQHAAMHQVQTYVQSMGVGGGGGGGGGQTAGGYLSGGGGLRARHTPLRHAHVTSTTHPHHLHGMSELNLRGLLTPARAARPPPAQLHPQHAMQHAYQQNKVQKVLELMGVYANNAYAASQANMAGTSGRRSGDPRTPSPAPPAQPAHTPAHATHAAHAAHAAHATLAAHAAHYHQQAKWHIPQHNLPNGGMEPMAAGSAAGDNFKITLGRQNPPARQPSLVTSTNPKTPSPSLHGGPLELDKVCADSVQDLMATIAKLDSNGVQVVAEGAEPAPSPAPHVHSSTDAAPPALPHAAPLPALAALAVKPLAAGAGAGAGAAGGATSGATGGAGATSGDPNEDWCAVCMDGGELMCCDKCPKVFHQYCHIPTIEKLPDETETWQCLLCVNFAELPAEPEGGGAGGEGGGGGGGGLSPRQRKVVERVTLELYCQYEPSLPFREPVPADNAHYHAKIQQPMCLDMVRMKLQPGAAHTYTHPAQFVSDVRLMFRNALHYNPPDSQIYKDAKRLEEFFDAQLLKWLPELAYWSGEGEPPAKRPRLD